ncbi:MAG TPA: inner membrane-spanning protein YciB [Afifellaceae bacterium]|nr:inner membrane-spanning protein YciB [Afifellaceae bacterium]
MKSGGRPQPAASALGNVRGAVGGVMTGGRHNAEAGGWDFVRGGALTRRLAVEVGPLAAFFVSFYVYGIFVATGVFMASTALAVIYSHRAERRLPVLPLLSLALILLFGGATLYWEDERFIMMRPTAINLFYGLALAVSWLFGAPLLKSILSPGLLLTEAGWQRLTARLALFLIALAVLNEIVWRNFDTEVWVTFKTFATVPLNALFFAFQMRLLRSQALQEPSGA